MILAFQVCGAIVAAALLGLFVFGLRRRLIQRSGGTFDCSLRLADVKEELPSGKGWIYGVARYSGDSIEWFRVFSYAPDPAGPCSAPRSRSCTAASPRARKSWPCCRTPSSWSASTAACGSSSR